MRWLIWFLSGLCFALISTHQMFWWLVLPAFGLFISAVLKATSWREVFCGGLLVGTLKCLGGYSWIWSTYPLTWVALNKLSQLLFIGAYWLSTSVFMGIGIAATAGLLFFIWQKYRSFFWVTFPVTWLGGEILGSFTASVILLGPGAYLNINIGHGYAGIALANVSLFYPFASLGGMYGLTFVAAVSGALLYFIWIHKDWSRLKKFFWTSYYLIALLILYVMFPTAIMPTLEKKVVVIDTRFSSKLLHSVEGERLKADYEIAAVLTAAKITPDVILLPEDSRLTDYLGGTDAAFSYLDSKIENDLLVVDSARVDTSNGAVLRAFYYDLKNQSVYTTDKQFFTPQGEYVTYPFIGLLKLFGQRQQLDKILNNQNYLPGAKNNYGHFPADVPGFLFCFESSSIFGLSKIADQRDSPLAFHAVSHARFHNPQVLWFQLDSMIRTQAIYTKRTVISAGNMASSKFYGPDGRIVSGELILRTEYFDLIEYNI